MFDTAFTAGPGVLLLGALAGLLFGFLLQKGGLTRHEVIVGQFLLRDFTVAKAMLTAIVVGGIGVYGMVGAGLLETMHVKGAQVLANVLGGLVFGVGMAILGYCPGTGVAAIGDGARDAIPGVLGMLFGAAIFAEVYPFFSEHVLPVGDLGKETLATATGLSPWWFLLALAALAAIGFGVSERRARSRPRTA